MPRFSAFLALALLLSAPFILCEDENEEQQQEEEEDQQDLSLHWFNNDNTCGTPYARGFDAGYDTGYDEGYQAAQEEIEAQQQEQNQQGQDEGQQGQDEGQNQDGQDGQQNNQKKDGENKEQEDGEGEVMSLDRPECSRLEIEVDEEEQQNNGNDGEEEERVEYFATVVLGKNSNKLKMVIFNSEDGCRAFLETEYPEEEEQMEEEEQNEEENAQKKKDGEQKEEEQQEEQQEEQVDYNDYLVANFQVACGECYQPLPAYTFYMSVECLSNRALAASGPSSRKSSSNSTSRVGVGFIGVICGAAVAIVALTVFRSRRSSQSESRPIRSNVRSYQQQDE